MLLIKYYNTNTREVRDPGTKAKVIDRLARRRRKSYEDASSLIRDGVSDRLGEPAKAGTLDAGNTVLGEGSYRLARRRRKSYENTGSLSRDGVSDRLREPVKAGILNTYASSHPAYWL